MFKKIYCGVFLVCASIVQASNFTAFGLIPSSYREQRSDTPPLTAPDRRPRADAYVSSSEASTHNSLFNSPADYQFGEGLDLDAEINSLSRVGFNLGSELDQIETSKDKSSAQPRPLTPLPQAGMSCSCSEKRERSDSQGLEENGFSQKKMNIERKSLALQSDLLESTAQVVTTENENSMLTTQFAKILSAGEFGQRKIYKSKKALDVPVTSTPENSKKRVSADQNPRLAGFVLKSQEGVVCSSRASIAGASADDNGVRKIYRSKIGFKK
jgi:hypothetical protein